MFLDEIGFSLALFLLYGWALRKERLVESVPLNRGKNVSVLGAFGAEGMIAKNRKIGAMQRVDVGAHASVMQVERFLEFDLLPNLPAGSVLVLDNAAIHHGGRIKEMVEAAGCSLLYLSPYSPDFSPIELAWSSRTALPWRWVKQRVRRLCPRDEQARGEAVESAIAALPKDFTKAWFEKCGYNLN